MDRLGGGLKIVAGDANAEPEDAGWWDDGKADGYRDPIAESAAGATAPRRTTPTAAGGSTSCWSRVATASATSRPSRRR
ncbi:hypothetical protein NKG94_13510 [Micromonospora sp. M12]